jgi:GNAT superfamily N-acetyltransferase
MAITVHFKMAKTSFNLRLATNDDLVFAEGLMVVNMSKYYERHNLTWRPDLFAEHWQKTENYILEDHNVPIGMLRVTQADDSLFINEVQVDENHQGKGGTFMLKTAHHWANERQLRYLHLSVFVDNPAAHLYVRMGYRGSARVAVHGSIKNLIRFVQPTD